MKRSLIFAALVFAGSAIAQSTMIEFRGVPLGVSEATWKTSFPEIGCGEPPAEVKYAIDRVCRRHRAGPADDAVLQFGGVIVDSIRADFSNDRLSRITVAIKPDQVGSIIGALTEKFGKPMSYETPEFKTQGGLTGNNTIAVWRIGSSKITATRFASSISKGLVEYSDDVGDAEFKRRVDAASKAGAKTL